MSHKCSFVMTPRINNPLLIGRRKDLSDIAVGIANSWTLTTESQWNRRVSLEVEDSTNSIDLDQDLARSSSSQICELILSVFQLKLLSQRS